MLWIQATNPAVSLPDLCRVRNTLQHSDLFIVVQDAFRTETTELADVVLPTALWGEKTGTFTNAERTVHISHQAVQPPGEARSDFAIFLDFARRMNLQDKDGAPLMKWATPEAAFEAWKECSRGRPCDYTGLSYDKLGAVSGIHWPCNVDHPDGEARLYETLHFPTDSAECETYGHDLVTGAAISSEHYRASNPAGRAILKSAEYQPPAEEPDSEYSYLLTTGRVVHHFHTRTKTGSSKELAEVSPNDFVQIAAEDAARMNIKEGDWVRLTSRRGSVETRATVGGVAPGDLFLPFHFGYWDDPGRARAANELTIYGWDPVSKQPWFKHAAVKLEKIGPHTPQRPDYGHVESGARRDITDAVRTVLVPAKSASPRLRFADYLGLVTRSEQRLREALDKVRTAHPGEADIAAMCTLFLQWSQDADRQLKPFIEKYCGPQRQLETVDEAVILRVGQDGSDLLRDLHDLCLLTSNQLIALTIVTQAAKALRDQQLEEAVQRLHHQIRREQTWFMTRLREASPQFLLVPS